jgi:hypothetical protein
MGTTVELFDTDIDGIRALVGSRDKALVKRVAKVESLDREAAAALESIVVYGRYDHSAFDHRLGFQHLARLQSRGTYSPNSGFEERSSYLSADLQSPRLAELIAYIPLGRDLMNGAPGVDEGELWVGYLTHDELRELLEGLRDVTERTPLIADELEPFLAELVAAGRDLCSVATRC